MNLNFRLATLGDLPGLLALEQQCFTHDRLSARSLRWMLSRAHASLMLVQAGEALLGYGLVLFRHGSDVARLYSLAVAPQGRGLGLGRQLLERAEACARAQGCAWLRLEVRPDNPAALGLYAGQGYRRFARVEDYYEDHSPALRLQKRLL